MLCRWSKSAIQVEGRWLWVMLNYEMHSAVVLCPPCSHSFLRHSQYLPSVGTLCWSTVFPPLPFVYMVIYWFENWFEHFSSVHTTFKIQLSSSLISAEGGNVKWKKRRYIYTQACSSIVEVQVCDRVECHRTIIAIPDRAQKLAWEFKYMGKRMRLCNILEEVPPPITLL